MKEEQERTPLRTILQNFLNHIEKLDTQNIEGSYEKEFQELKLFSEILKTSKHYSCSEGEKEVNRKKNRYKDILPFDGSRVILDGYAGVPGSDYINANFIKGASGSPAYIASQGPLPHTVNDFWRMVVECEVQVIVMACNEEEAGKHKCENYWVEHEGEEKQFGMVGIRLVKASVVCPDFLVRTMRLKYTNSQSIVEERTVCQFHYSAWPDHGVPPLVRPLLDMVRLVRDTQASETLPVLVHCSAGCGRTGTICAIDYVWGLLRAGKLTNDFSLFKLVRDMRRQRIAMVQTKEQYVLVHHAVRELFCEQLRMIDSHPYENIDVNGLPLVKEGQEPMYATVFNENSNEEKQDNKEKEGSLQEETIVPPLPHKKRAHIASSKQEKEVENLTEKQRLIVEQSSSSDTGSGSSVSSLLQKPRIAKLKALFERSSLNRESRNLHSKQRNSQQVTRSHSLGAVRKCNLVEQSVICSGVKPREESSSKRPIPSRGILRIPQLATASALTVTPTSPGRPALPIKRSKSLKVLGSSDRYKLSVVAMEKSSPFKAVVNQKTNEASCDKVVSCSEVNALVPHFNNIGVKVKDDIPIDLKPCVPPKKIVRDRNSVRELEPNAFDIDRNTSSKHYVNVSHFPFASCVDTQMSPAMLPVSHCRRRRSLESFSSTLEEAVSPDSHISPCNMQPRGNCSQDASKSSHLDKDAHKLWQDCRDYLLSSTKSEACLTKKETASKQQDILSAGASKSEFQNLTVEAQRKINSIIAGLGVRERRNSFRQAINTSKDKPAETGGNKIQKYEAIWLGQPPSYSVDGNLNSVQSASVSTRKDCHARMDCTSNSVEHCDPHSVPLPVATKRNQGSSVKKNVRQNVPQQVEKCVKAIRTESSKQNSKTFVGKTASLRIKGKQVMDFSRDLELGSSKVCNEVGSFQYSGYSQLNSNIRSRRVEDNIGKLVTPTKKNSRSNQWPNTTPHNIGPGVAKINRSEMPLGTTAASQESARKYPVSSGPVLSNTGTKMQELRSVNSSVAKRVNVSEAVPVFWPCVNVSDTGEKMKMVPKKSECSRDSSFPPSRTHGTETTRAIDVLPGYRESSARVKSKEFLDSRESGVSERSVGVVEVSKPFYNPRTSHTCTSLQEKKNVRSSEMETCMHVLPSQGSLSQNDTSDSGVEGARAVVVRRQEQQLAAARRDGAAANRPATGQATPKHKQRETDVVSYGLVAGVQLQRGSRDDLALCSSLGPTAPPRVRRHASVVLLRHSLIETSEGAPVAPLTIWNTPQQGQDKGPGVHTRSSPGTQKSEEWRVAPGVDIDAVAASIKPRRGDQGTPLTRALEALHLRKSSSRTAPHSPPMTRLFGEHSINPSQSPSVKKQHYL